jgi:hypothetical protein
MILALLVDNIRCLLLIKLIDGLTVPALVAGSHSNDAKSWVCS